MVAVQAVVAVSLLAFLPFIYFYEKLRKKTIDKYYIVGNKNSDRTIVFIHGLQDDHSMWDKQIATFKGTYKCILINRTAGDNATYLDAPEIYEIIKNNTSPDDEIISITASAGCFPAAEIQKEYKIFSKMLFLNMFFNQERMTAQFWSEQELNQVSHMNIYVYYEYLCYAMNRDIFFSYPIWFLGGFLRKFARKTYRPDIYADAVLLLKKRWNKTLRQRRATAHGYLTLPGFASRENWRRIQRSKENSFGCPVLSIIGTRDNIGHLNSPYNMEEFAQRHGHPLILLKGAGHWFNESHSEFVNKVIERFLLGAVPDEIVQSMEIDQDITW